MLDINTAIEKIKWTTKSESRYVYVFYCIQCKTNTIRCRERDLTKHTGRCRFCAHRGLPFMGTYNHFRNGVFRTNKRRKKQKTVELTYEEFLEFTKIANCHYCNIKLTWNEHGGKGQHRTNLDRKDSSQGYHKENLVVCCKRCNYMKGSEFSYSEFKAIVNLLDKMRNGFFIKKNLDEEAASLHSDDQKK